MNEKVEFVDYQEALSIKVGKWLSEKGFAPASCTGIALYSLSETNSLGILWKDPDAKPREYLFGLIKREPKRRFLGTIWFDNSTRGANKKYWVLEAYGQEHIELVRQLAEKMTSIFNVKISLRLVREQPDVETYCSGCDY